MSVDTVTGSNPVAPPDPNTAFRRTRDGGYFIDDVDRYLTHFRLYARHLEAAISRAAGRLVTGAEHAAATPQAQAMVGDLLQMALDEITGQKSAAENEARKILSAATAQAASLLDGARQEAAAVAGGARQQADTVISSARAEAKRLTDDAAGRAAAVSATAEQRLRALQDTHAETMRRIGHVNEVIGQVQQVTTDLMAAEEDRGPLEDEVARALPPANTAATA